MRLELLARRQKTQLHKIYDKRYQNYNMYTTLYLKNNTNITQLIMKRINLTVQYTCAGTKRSRRLCINYYALICATSRLYLFRIIIVIISNKQVGQIKQGQIKQVLESLVLNSRDMLASTSQPKISNVLTNHITLQSKFSSTIWLFSTPGLSYSKRKI